MPRDSSRNHSWQCLVGTLWDVGDWTAVSAVWKASSLPAVLSFRTLVTCLSVGAMFPHCPPSHLQDSGWDCVRSLVPFETWIRHGVPTGNGFSDTLGWWFFFSTHISLFLLGGLGTWLPHRWVHELILIPGLRASLLSYFTNLADARKGICALLSVVDLGWTWSLGAKGETVQRRKLCRDLFAALGRRGSKGIFGDCTWAQRSPSSIQQKSSCSAYSGTTTQTGLLSWGEGSSALARSAALYHEDPFHLGGGRENAPWTH